MTQSGFFEPKRLNPSGLALVIAMHAAALGALAVMKGPEIVRPFFPDTQVEFIPLPQDPPENPPPPRDERPQPAQRPSQIDRPQRELDVPTRHPPVFGTSDPPVISLDSPGRQVIEPRIAPPPPPVRTEAAFDPRYAGDLQPPYPPAEQRAQREGSVRLRLTIGADGRVRAVQRLAASSDAFWSATERHAKSRWRFRPATLDGRPVESSKVMTVFFRIEA
jgi:protein TonB